MLQRGQCVINEGIRKIKSKLTAHKKTDAYGKKCCTVPYPTTSYQTIVTYHSR